MSHNVQKGQQAPEVAKMGFLKIFLRKSMVEIKHLLPKDERKEATKKTIEELLDDMMLYVCHTLGGQEKSEFDWERFISSSEKLQKLIKDNKELIEQCTRKK